MLTGLSCTSAPNTKIISRFRREIPNDVLPSSRAGRREDALAAASRRDGHRQHEPGRGEDGLAERSGHATDDSQHPPVGPAHEQERVRVLVLGAVEVAIG